MRDRASLVESRFLQLRTIAAIPKPSAYECRLTFSCMSVSLTHKKARDSDAKRGLALGSELVSRCVSLGNAGPRRK